MVPGGVPAGVRQGLTSTLTRTRDRGLPAREVFADGAAGRPRDDDAAPPGSGRGGVVRPRPEARPERARVRRTGSFDQAFEESSSSSAAGSSGASTTVISSAAGPVG